MSSLFLREWGRGTAKQHTGGASSKGINDHTKYSRPDDNQTLIFHVEEEARKCYWAISSLALGGVYLTHTNTWWENYSLLQNQRSSPLIVISKAKKKGVQGRERKYKNEN